LITLISIIDFIGNKKTPSYPSPDGDGISKISGKRIVHLFKSPYEWDLGGLFKRLIISNNVF
jgi:hypothetical protein